MFFDSILEKFGWYLIVALYIVCAQYSSKFDSDFVKENCQNKFCLELAKKLVPEYIFTSLRLKNRVSGEKLTKFQ